MSNIRKVLVVDDDSELREALKEQLSLHEEFDALVAENGGAAVQAVKVGQIDLVIMDVGLPDIDGYDAVRILRKNGFKAPIIMLTGRETPIPTPSSLSNPAPTITSPSRSGLPFYSRASAPSFANTKQVMTPSSRSANIRPAKFEILAQPQG